MIDSVPDANPIKPNPRAIEHLAAFATAYRYPSPAGRIKPAPLATDLASYIAEVEAALAVAVTRFVVDPIVREPPPPAGYLSGTYLLRLLDSNQRPGG